MVGPRTGESSSAGKTFDRRYLLLGLVPAVVYVLFYVVLHKARPTGIEFPIVAATDSPGIAALEAHYRYLWISAFLLSGAASLAVAVSCALRPGRDASA
jgi:hypothetical protein